MEPAPKRKRRLFWPTLRATDWREGELPYWTLPKDDYGNRVRPAP